MTDEEAEKLIAEVAAIREELKTKDAIIAELLKRLYGTKSEKLDTGQLLLDLLGEDPPKKPDAAGGQETPAAEDTGKQPQKRRRRKLHESLQHLPTLTTEITPEEILTDPGAYRRIGQERSEHLEVRPTAFTLHITIRPTYVKKSSPEAKPTTAPLPLQLLEGSVLTASLGAHLLTEKFCYHQPFWRQEQKLRTTHDIEIARNVMCHWHDHLAGLLQPIYDLIATRLRESNYLKVDETPIRYLAPGTGKTATGQFWVYHHQKHGPLFDWHTSRAATCLEHILLGKKARVVTDPHAVFKGHLQSDGLRAYRKFIDGRPGNEITPVSCLAHIRRKFHEARDDHPKIASWILYQIGKIYEIESKLRKVKASHRFRRHVRRKLTRRHYDHLAKLINHLGKKSSITPASKLGKALHYAHAQWSHLEPCFEHGQIEFDNNLTENAIRPTKLGMKNWMFIGGADTGQRSAIIYTMVEQVRRLGHDPYAYLKWVFERLPGMTNQSDFAPLLPVSWAARLETREKATKGSPAAAVSPTLAQAA